jgi:hypothetical protein
MSENSGGEVYIVSVWDFRLFHRESMYKYIKFHIEEEKDDDLDFFL